MFPARPQAATRASSYLIKSVVSFVLSPKPDTSLQKNVKETVMVKSTRKHKFRASWLEDGNVEQVQRTEFTEPPYKQDKIIYYGVVSLHHHASDICYTLCWLTYWHNGRVEHDWVLQFDQSNVIVVIYIIEVVVFRVKVDWGSKSHIPQKRKPLDLWKWRDNIINHVSAVVKQLQTKQDTMSLSLCHSPCVL